MPKTNYLTHNACLQCASIDPGCCRRCHPFVLFADIALLLKHCSPKRVVKMLEVSEISPQYFEHLSDPEMIQVYYPWGGSYFRVQTKFLNGSCIALKPGKGCVMQKTRPLMCKVFPFWWVEGADLSTKDFAFEINGECTMVTLWKFPISRVLKELNLSEEQIREELVMMNKALDENHKILDEAKNENVPPTKLLNWLINRAKHVAKIHNNFR